MQRYPVRTSHRSHLAAAELERLMRETFGTASVEGTVATASYGAIVRLAAHAEQRDLAVEVTMNPKVPDEVARETIARYNRFLEAATGFNAKERAKRLRKSAGGPATEA